MGPKKSTKKFEKNHLKSTLERRKEGAKIKQRVQTKTKRQARNAADKAREPELGDEKGGDKQSGGEKDKVKLGGKVLSEMSVDEFFAGGFEVPEDTRKKGKGRKGLANGEAGSHTGKRKRGEEDEGVEEDGSDSDGGDIFDTGGGEEEIEALEGEEGLEMQKGDLEALAEKDPEFYAFLKENDQELLDFDEDGGVELADGMDEEETSKSSKKKKKRREEKDGEREDEEVEEDEEMDVDQDSEVTLAMVKKWKTAMSEQHSLRATRQVVLAFRAAAYINAEDEKQHKYTITTPEVYHELLITALEQVPAVLTHHLPPKELPSGKVRIATDSKKFRSLSPLLKSFSVSICQLLESLSDAPTLKLTLNALHPLVPYLLSFRKVLQDFTKIIISIWSSTISTSSTTILLTAFLLLRRLFTLADPTLRTAILKTLYLHLIRSSRTTNTHTLPTIHLLKTTAAELFTLDPPTSYPPAFTSLRQLAILLRSTITKPTPDAHKQIYNWQYVHSLDFWSLVLSRHCSPTTNPHLKSPQDSPLHPLIYPLVQLTLGALRLHPSPTHFPLRFHLTRSLLHLSSATKTYIPLAPPLLEILASPSLSHAPKPSTLPPLDFALVLKAPPAYLRTRTYQDGLGIQVQELLAEFFACWQTNVAFPELIVPPTVAIKRWLKSTSSSSTPQTNPTTKRNNNKNKTNKNTKLHSLFTLLLQKLSAQAEFIARERANVRLAPGMRQEVEGFLKDRDVGEMPLGAFVEGLRVRREESRKVLDKAREAGGGGVKRGVKQRVGGEEEE